MPSTTTVGDLLTNALTDCGAFNVGMPPPAKAITKALLMFNWLISQWNRKRYLIYHLVDYKATSTGQQVMLIGPGGVFQDPSGDLPDPRPDKLNSAFMRQLNASPNTPVDYPLRLVESYEDYSRISLKTLQTWTQFVFYDPAYPNGNLYFWPIQVAGTFEFHVQIKQILSRYVSVAQLLGVPDEYEWAFYSVLKVRLGATYRLPPNPVDIGSAKDAMNTLRGANSAIASLKFPRAVRASRNKYNIYSDDN
jgi:hypothetical protein